LELADDCSSFHREIESKKEAIMEKILSVSVLSAMLISPAFAVAP
jgi:hypothetical protein